MPPNSDMGPGGFDSPDDLLFFHSKAKENDTVELYVSVEVRDRACLDVGDVFPIALFSPVAGYDVCKVWRVRLGRGGVVQIPKSVAEFIGVDYGDSVLCAVESRF